MIITNRGRVQKLSKMKKVKKNILDALLQIAALIIFVTRISVLKSACEQVHSFIFRKTSEVIFKFSVHFYYYRYKNLMNAKLTFSQKRQSNADKKRTVTKIRYQKIFKIYIFRRLDLFLYMCVFLCFCGLCVFAICNLCVM